MKSFAEDLLAECFAAAGLDPDKAILAARVALRVGLAAGIVPKKHLASWERGARAYELRGPQKLESSVIAHRLGCPQWSVFRLVKRHKSRVSAAKKAARAA